MARKENSSANPALQSLRDYHKKRAVWLKALHVGCTANVQYGNSEYDGHVYQATKHSVWCRFTIREGSDGLYTTKTHWIRFARKTGLQWGGGMMLHIPEVKK